MLYRLYIQVNIKIGPVKMVIVQELEIVDGSDGGVPKPGKLFERKERLFVSD
jgi:hypothetical protein